MFFMLNLRNRARNSWKQLGIVVAESFEEAAQKLDKKIDPEGQNSSIICELRGANPEEPEYTLEYYPEIASLQSLEEQSGDDRSPETRENSLNRFPDYRDINMPDDYYIDELWGEWTNG